MTFNFKRPAPAAPAAPAAAAPFVPPISGPPVAAAAAPAAPRAPFGGAPGRSRWAGVKASEPRHPIIGAGQYCLRVVDCEIPAPKPGVNETVRTTFEIVAAGDGAESAVGETVVAIEMLGGKAGAMGMGRFKAMAMAAAGFESESDFDAFDPNGEFLDGIFGTVNAYSAAGWTIVGRLVNVSVTHGNPVLGKDKQPTGDYYRNYAWYVVGEQAPAPWFGS